jgi:2-succinyl-5-enolpyruvyl-6-hydroxy-3-cyclohexene-1-carboxylate synthase
MYCASNPNFHDQQRWPRDSSSIYLAHHIKQIVLTCDRPSRNRSGRNKAPHTMNYLRAHGTHQIYTPNTTRSRRRAIRIARHIQSRSSRLNHTKHMHVTIPIPSTSRPSAPLLDHQSDPRESQQPQSHCPQRSSYSHSRSPRRITCRKP